MNDKQTLQRAANIGKHNAAMLKWLLFPFIYPQQRYNANMAVVGATFKGRRFKVGVFDYFFNSSPFFKGVGGELRGAFFLEGRQVVGRLRRQTARYWLVCSISDPGRVNFIPSSSSVAHSICRSKGPHGITYSVHVDPGILSIFFALVFRLVIHQYSFVLIEAIVVTSSVGWFVVMLIIF